MEVILAIYRSAATGRTVELPLERAVTRADEESGSAYRDHARSGWRQADVAGHRITVANIAIWHERLGRQPMKSPPSTT